MTMTFIKILALVMTLAFLPTASFAGEDPRIAYSKTDGKIDTSTDTNSSGYMRNKTKLTISCSQSGCANTPEPVLPPVGKPLARSDDYRTVIYGDDQGRDGGLQPSKVVPMTQEQLMNGHSKDWFNTWSMSFLFPVLSNDDAGPYGPVKITNLAVKSNSGHIASLKTSGNQIELTLTMEPYVNCSVRDEEMGRCRSSARDLSGSTTFSYTITDTKNQSSTATVTHSLGLNPSPLVLDLDGDGIELLPLSQGALFDISMDGIPDKVSWVYSDDGLLALDRNGDGIINHRKELFGNLREEKLSDGFESLRRYDDNDDYKIDATDKMYPKLLVWRDLNKDGVGTANELQTLSKLGIESINLNAVGSGFLLGENVISGESFFVRNDGSRGQIVDVWFAQILGSPAKQ